MTQSSKISILCNDMIFFSYFFTLLQLVEEKDAAFYPSSESDEEDEDEEEGSNGVEKPKAYTVDPDHRLLLRSCLPLLKSRNAAVSEFVYLLGLLI